MSKKNKNATNNNNTLPAVSTKSIVEALVRKGWRVDEVCGNAYFINLESLPESLYGSPVIDNIPNKDVINSFVKDLGVPPVFCMIKAGRGGNNTTFAFGFEVVENFSLRYLTVSTLTVRNNENVEDILERVKASQPLHHVFMYALVTNSLRAYKCNNNYCYTNNLFENVYLDIPEEITDDRLVGEVIKSVDYFINGFPLTGNGHIGNCVIDDSVVSKWVTPLVGVTYPDWDFMAKFANYLDTFYKNIKAKRAA
jgi:hypothetical protein